MEGYLTATGIEDWAMILEVCERASSSEANAKVAIKVLEREFKSVPPSGPSGCAGLITAILRYGDPPGQLSAARVSRSSSAVLVPLERVTLLTALGDDASKLIASIHPTV